MPDDDQDSLSPRVRIQRPALASEIDELGHVSNIAYVRWVQDAAAAHSIAVGWDFPRYQREGSVFVVRKHEITYFAPAYLDDHVTCTTWIEGWRGASSPRRTVISRDADAAKLAECTTLWALVEIASGRPRRIPKELRDAFALVPPGGDVVPLPLPPTA